MNRPPAIPAYARSQSPCVRNCCLDDDDVCLGCGRRIDEIVRWHAAPEAERATILEAAGARLAERRRRRGF